MEGLGGTAISVRKINGWRRYRKIRERFGARVPEAVEIAICEADNFSLLEFQ
jgi:hypothetical protein